MMTNWTSPVREVGDVVIVGERHREQSSRAVLTQVWSEHTFEHVCVEVGPGTSYRGDGGGAIGGALTRAEQNSIPRYYVDEPDDTITEAFGGIQETNEYLESLEDRYPSHEDGLIEMDTVEEVRQEIQQLYGDTAVELLLENRERRMAARTRWVAEQSDGKTLLVVGAAHLEPIAELIEQGVEPVGVEKRRIRRGERLPGKTNLMLMFYFIYMELKNRFLSAPTLKSKFKEKLPF